VVGLYPLLDSPDGVTVVLHLQSHIPQDLLLLAQHSHHPLLYLQELPLLLLHRLPEVLLQLLYIGQRGTVQPLQATRKH
jgi:hypothetical protein